MCSSGRKGGGEGQMMAQKGASCCSVQIYGFDGPKPYYDQWLGTAIRKMVQHARAVVSPASAGEKAVMELYEATTRRLTGKQPLHLEGRKIKEPAQHDDLPQLLREDLRVADDSHNVWGSWQVKIRRRMWKAWHTLLTTVYPWMKLLWNCGQVLQNTALFKCDGFGLLQPNFGS